MSITNRNQIKGKDDFMPNYGYAYNNGKNIIEFYAVDENVAHMKACKWAINTNNFIQPLGKVIDTPKYAHKYTYKKCMK